MKKTVLALVAVFVFAGLAHADMFGSFGGFNSSTLEQMTGANQAGGNSFYDIQKQDSEFKFRKKQAAEKMKQDKARQEALERRAEHSADYSNQKIINDNGVIKIENF